jgi:hypothetical protein
MVLLFVIMFLKRTRSRWLLTLALAVSKPTTRNRFARERLQIHQRDNNNDPLAHPHT